MTKKQLRKLWDHFRWRIQDGIQGMGALPRHTRTEPYLWVLPTIHGDLRLSLNNPDLLDSGPTFSLFGRFEGNGPYPSDANQYSGKWNFHLAGPTAELTKEDVDAFVDRTLARIETVNAYGRKGTQPRRNPASFDAAERTWEMQSLARHYGRPEPEEDERISVTVYGPDGEVLADTRQVTWNGRKATVLDEYLDELKRGESLLDADTLEALLRGRRPDDRGRMDVELTAEEAKTLRPNPRRRVTVSLSKARRNPAGSEAVLLFKGSGLALADDSDEENRLRAGGWDEAGEKVVRKLAKLRSLDKNGWAELTDRMFTEGELDRAIEMVTRQNPAVQGGSGQYRLHYMEPGKRPGTWRQAIRKVDSVAEAERWLTDFARQAKLPASVMTPGNRYQKPEVVAILGQRKESSYDRLPV